MATKSETKSKIPLKVMKKELAPERPRMTFGNCNYLKPSGKKENKERSKPFKNTVDNINKATENLKVTTKEKFCEEKQDSKPKFPPVRSDIETLSQDLVSRLKTDKLPDCSDNRTNVIPKNKDGTSSKTVTRPKKSTSPSALVKPKNCQPHSGLILKPTVKKSTVTVKPFNIKSDTPKLRRSISEYDFKFVRPKAETNRPQQKDRNIKGKDRNTVDERCAKTTKSETFSKLKKIDNKTTKEFPVHPKNPIAAGRMSKQFPVDKNPVKPVTFKSKPLRRSNTMHAFDSVPILKKDKGVQTNKTVPETVKLEKRNTPGTPENIKLELQLSENIRAQFTPKKEIPHGGLVMNINAARINKKMNVFLNVD